MHLENILGKEASHRESHIVQFHSHEMSRRDKFIRWKVVVAWGGTGGRGVDWEVTAKGSRVSLGVDETLLKFLKNFIYFTDCAYVILVP